MTEEQNELAMKEVNNLERSDKWHVYGVLKEAQSRLLELNDAIDLLKRRQDEARATLRRVTQLLEGRL